MIFIICYLNTVLNLNVIPAILDTHDILLVRINRDGHNMMHEHFPEGLNVIPTSVDTHDIPSNILFIIFTI